MKKYIEVGFIIAIILGCTYAALISKSCNQLWKDKQRLWDNQSSLLNPSTTKIDKAGSKVKTGGVINLTSGEFEESQNKEINIIKNSAKDMGIKPKNISQGGVITIQIVDSGKTKIVDSVGIDSAMKPIVIDSIKVGTWKNTWSKIDFTVTKDSIGFKLQTQDTAILVIHKHKIGKWRLINLIKPREIGYDYSIKLTRPNADIDIKEVIINK